MPEVTRLLNAAAPAGAADEAVLQAVYEELRQMARGRMARERPGQTLQATELVHEAWLRLRGGAQWNDRAHFFGAASEAMRRILIDRARRRLAQCRGGGAAHQPVDDLDLAAPGHDEEMLAIHEALADLEKQDAQLAALVKLRYFTGLTLEESAEALGISAPTAKRRWVFTRAWLAERLRG